MSDDRKAAIVCWTIAFGKVALSLAIAAVILLIMALAGAADNGSF